MLRSFAVNFGALVYRPSTSFVTFEGMDMSLLQTLRDAGQIATMDVFTVSLRGCLKLQCKRIATRLWPHVKYEPLPIGLRLRRHITPDTFVPLFITDILRPDFSCTLIDMAKSTHAWMA